MWQTDRHNTVRPSWREQLLLVAAGALTSLAFLPADLLSAFPLLSGVCGLIPIVTLIPLLRQWQATNLPRRAAYCGFIFAFAMFVVGMHWVIIAMTTFGGMSQIIALPLLLLLLAYLAAFTAAVGWCAVRFFHGRWRALALPGLWVAFELLRQWLFGGMPWLVLGSSQGAGTVFASFIPIGGVYLASFIVVAVASLVTLCPRQRLYAVSALLLLAVGVGLSFINWSRPQGEPLPVTLVQGNIAQDIKFDPAFAAATYTRYYHLVEQSKGRLILLPESAFPDFLDLVPEEEVKAYLNLALHRRADLLIGAFTRDADPVTGRDRYYNSVFSLGESPLQIYRKRHLVLFGEKIPFESVVAPLMNALIHIPIAGQQQGAADQPPFAVAGQQVAISICFEDVFGGEQIERVRHSTLLANFTNDAWYAHSIAAWQHHRIASLRALESGRPLLRVTNTGITAIIDHNGRTVAHLPWFTVGNLEAQVQGRTGNTPYLLWGDILVCLIALVVIISSRCFSVKRQRSSE